MNRFFYFIFFIHLILPNCSLQSGTYHTLKLIPHPPQTETYENKGVIILSSEDKYNTVNYDITVLSLALDPWFVQFLA
jgi:hypothetical protein